MSWEEAKIFEANPDKRRIKIFVTFPYPYMNGPLHVGHGFSASRVDVYARYKRMMGYNVLFPWAWHWTGETIAGASERVKLGDENLIRAFRDIDSVPEDEILKFVDPVYMAEYYTKDSKVAVKQMGFSIDWRREFHTTSYDSCFSRFVEWQYINLKDKGFVAKGTYPVVWCPKCESPTGEADRLEGEDIAPEEYILIKFKFDNQILPGATFRPETIYGATNLWVNPEVEYTVILLNYQEWIVSEEAASKLTEQMKNVKVVGKLAGKKMIGKYVDNPLNGRKLLILPGWFVDPKVGTGIVYSVPAHAPYDWIALKDLKEKPEILKEFGVDPKTIESIEPISIIRLEGLGEFPAIEIVNEMKIKDQNDLRLEEATKVIYRKEFHGGILKENCMEHAGKRVRAVKEELIQDFKKNGIADLMYDLPSSVICRCTSPCVVKVLEDQWFLRYSDKGWKEKAHACVAKAKIYPNSVREWFDDIIDWFREKACARKTGLGTPLPWSPDWIVETLSDSTIYTAYYTISKYINRYGFKASQLKNEVFDYIFYGLADLAHVSSVSEISAEVLKEMRSEFLYWYPVDLRNSAKELVPNHLTFFIFHHVALFEPEFWPKMISANGMLMVEGKKMSKSKGNFVTLKKAIERFGADPTRCALLLAAEDIDDPDWRSDNVADIRIKLEAFYNLAKQIEKMEDDDVEIGHLERWLLSVLQYKLKTVSENLEVLKTRTALESALFGIWNDFRWYFRRTNKPCGRILQESLDIWVRLLAPFTPHLCEEVWKDINGSGFVSLAPWPIFDMRKISIASEEMEKLVKDVLEDILSILRATGLTPKKIIFYTASDWKWKTYLEALKLAEKELLTVNNLMPSLMKDSSLKNIAKQVTGFVQKIVGDLNKMPNDVLQRRLETGIANELETLKNATDFFVKEFNATIEIYNEFDSMRYDPKGRAQLAQPYRPAIYIE